MGIYDREYYREATAGSGLLTGMAPVCKAIIAINVAVFVLQMLTGGRGDGITDLLSLDPRSVLQGGQVWRILTYGFCHSTGDPLHILFNMALLWWFGKILELQYGSREFLAFYLTAIVLSGLAFLLFGIAIGSAAASIGASGGVMAVLTVYAMYYPTQKMLVFFVIPIEIRWLLPLYIAYDLWPVLRQLGGMGGMDHIAHAAHLGGALYGFLYKSQDLRFNRLFGGFAARRSPPRVMKVRLYQEPPPPPEPRPNTAQFDERVDEILKKIASEGEASLTEDERSTLTEASRRYRHRRGGG